MKHSEGSLWGEGGGLVPRWIISSHIHPDKHPQQHTCGDRSATSHTHTPGIKKNALALLNNNSYSTGDVCIKNHHILFHILIPDVKTQKTLYRVRMLRKNNLCDTDYVAHGGKAEVLMRFLHNPGSSTISDSSTGSGSDV